MSGTWYAPVQGTMFIADLLIVTEYGTSDKQCIFVLNSFVLGKEAR